MNCKDEWRDLRQKSRILAREAQIEPFCEWADRFAEEEKERTGAFNDWIACDKAQRLEWLRQLVTGKTAIFRDGPQIEGVMLASLFSVLTFGRCIVTSCMRMNTVLIRKISVSFEELDNMPLRYVGNIAGFSSSLTFKDVTNFPIVVSDYFMMVTALHAMPACFPQGLPIFFLEIDSCLYGNRLIFYDHSSPKSSGMIYRTNTEKFPQWKTSENVCDVPDDLRKFRIEVGGSISLIDARTARELTRQMPFFFKEKVPSTGSRGYTAFCYRTTAERTQTLVRDILKCKGDAIVFYIEEELGRQIMEELRKSGQECLLVKDTEEAATALATHKEKHVLLHRQISSTLSSKPLERRPGALFIADLFLCDNSYSKVYASFDRLFIQSQHPRHYFSLEDTLIKIYEQQGGFEKLFTVMEFTEKYDPWRQIRRILAKSILHKLDKLRGQALDDNLPIPVTSLENKRAKYDNAHAVRKGVVKANKMIEGLCFCGSGKPFKECHGKPRTSTTTNKK